MERQRKFPWKMPLVPGVRSTGEVKFKTARRIVDVLADGIDKNGKDYILKEKTVSEIFKLKGYMGMKVIKAEKSLGIIQIYLEAKTKTGVFPDIKKKLLDSGIAGPDDILVDKTQESCEIVKISKYRFNMWITLKISLT